MSTRKLRPALLAAMAAVLVAGAAGCTQTAQHVSSAASPSSSATSGQPPPCSPNPPPEAPPAKPTTVTTIGQAYCCIFAHYYAGPVLDDRVLLAAAFAGFTQELNRLGMDQPHAAMPALTGQRDKDWHAFAAVYQKVTGQLPASPAQRQQLAAATMTGMIASLHDNHARWSYPAPPPGDVPGDLGIITSPGYLLADTAPQEALPPLFVTAVLPGFFPGAADQVLQAIPNPAKGAKLHGLILDLRGNGGGDPAEVSRLLGAFTHGAAYIYLCDVHDSCAATRTDTDVPLLHLPLVVLTDRNCVSACDAFSGAVKDLRLGTLVGTRTGGILSGPAAPYLLDDASLIILPPKHAFGADHEIIDGIGVAPDYYLPVTAQDLSTGHDPDIAKALTLLGG